jgi:6-pyruvoyltetrahydropterin/6-carboxytetrahydropterin synthase
MYAIAVRRDFIAQHYLIGGDWGAENELHSHHYQVEVQLEGAELDRHGYLVDIVAIEKALEELVARFRDCILNDLAEFEGLNPSIEHFSRILWSGFAPRLQAGNLQAVRVRLWENEIAWAEYWARLDDS